MERIILEVDNVRRYIEDVVIFSKNTDTIAMQLVNVFRILKGNELRLRIKKYSFMQLCLQLIGHIFNKNGVHIDDRRVKKVRDALSPTIRKGLISFLGLASYFRRFIPGFAKIAKSLNEKTSDKVKLVWSEEMQAAFEELKLKLRSAPVLFIQTMKSHS